MKFFHFAVIAAMVVAILASPLKGETWVVLAKPGYEVIGTFELDKGGMVDVNVDTREQCLKLFEITESVPADVGQVITTKEGQEVIEGKSVDVVTISLSKEKIQVGFVSQKYKFRKGKFEAKQAMEIP